MPKELLRSFEDPTRDNTRIIHVYPRAANLPLDLPLTPDPRKPKVGSETSKRIGKSLRGNDGRFHLLNRGITLSVEDYSYDPKAEVLRLSIPEGEEGDTYGIIDGGHTYEEIRRNLKAVATSDLHSNSVPFASQHVHLEVLVRVQEDLADIAEARNFSVSLKPWTLAGYRNKFDWLLKALGADFASKIRISENDPEPVSILDVIQVMAAMNPVLFPDGKPALEAYKNAGKCLTYFTAEGDEYEFHRQAPVAGDILSLYDYIRKNWPEHYNKQDEEGKHGRYGARVEAGQRKKSRVAMATHYFLPQAPTLLAGEPAKVQGKYPIEKGFAIPVIASLRQLLVKNEDGSYGWYTNPFEFWDRYGPQLVRIVMAASSDAGNNPHTVGRDPRVHQSLYASVRSFRIEDYLKNKGMDLPF